MTIEHVFTPAHELFGLDPDRVRCPYPIFATLREQAPVAWFDELDSFVVSRYDLIQEVQRQPDVFSNRYATGPAMERALADVMAEIAGDGKPAPEMTPILLLADPPEHGRQRALVNRAFSPAAIRRIEPDMRVLADELIDGFVERARVELVGEFAVPFPMTVIATALGVPLDRMEDFMGWSRRVVAGIGTSTIDRARLADVLQARHELSRFVVGVIDERMREPADDLISQIAHAEIDGERLRRREIVEMVAQFLLAGNDTTAKLLATAVFRLAREPEFADRLRADGELITPFVEEVLRLEPPINGIYRVATADYDLGGVRIPAGSSVWMVYASGNRDPEQFEAPDELRVPRDGKAPHLAFGFGEHFCLGAALARAEARIGLDALLSRCADIRLDIDPDDAPWDPSFMLHGLQELPLTFRPAVQPAP